MVMKKTIALVFLALMTMGSFAYPKSEANSEYDYGKCYTSQSCCQILLK